eukprot:GEMP01037271.1.p1 GENE.GEMP01037271.1~~GEMP01037271.1.p1  ORF type:complete len:556 (+),score=53.10 GEMP01037271.1:20-1687(+)
MAGLFANVLTGDGDVVIKLGLSEWTEVRCHSVVLKTQPYFLNMLQGSVPMKERRNGEIRIEEDFDVFFEVLRYIYTGQLNICELNAGGLLDISDKYCIDDVRDKVIHWICFTNFSPDIFYEFIMKTWILETSYKEKLRDSFMESLKVRKHLCKVADDRRWGELPVDVVEEILSMEELPVHCEADVLNLISRWLGDTSKKDSKENARRLLRCFRVGKDVHLKLTCSEIQPILDILKTGNLIPKLDWPRAFMRDPPFIVNSHDDNPSRQEIEYVMGPRDFLQQVPGWFGPITTRLRVWASCQSWSRRERRLDARNSHGRSGTGKIERQPSPPKFSTVPSPKPAGLSSSNSPRGGVGGVGAVGSVANLHSVRWDRNVDSDASSEGGDRLQTPFGRRGMLSGNGNGKDSDDQVLHALIIGLNCGGTKVGIRVSQRDDNAIYSLEYHGMAKKRNIQIGGTTTDVTFDVQLQIGEPNAAGLSKCKVTALSLSGAVLMDHAFDISSFVMSNFYITSSQLDSQTSFTVKLNWFDVRSRSSPTKRNSQCPASLDLPPLNSSINE